MPDLPEMTDMQENLKSGSVQLPNYIVGIGASAGGLQPLQDFFDNMPQNTGLAFVVVQHVSPDYKSLMSELLARHTEMEIFRVEEGMEIHANCIYLIPPKRLMTIKDGKLHLHKTDETTKLPMMPINAFLISCAKELKKRAIGIILSGTGTDGTHGIAEISDAGGLTIAQDELTAKFTGMTQSAVDTGKVDLVTSPETMPGYLLDYVHAPDDFRNTMLANRDNGKLTGIESIMDSLKEGCHIDFSHFKPATVDRRIERRVRMTGADTLEEYAIRLKNDPEEVNALYRDLLIGVTHFFRDIEAFERLKYEVIPDLFAKAKERADDDIRIWVAGCATGEEAYSIAILMHEYLEKHKPKVNVRIFATDAYRHSLTFASAGRFKKEALKNVGDVYKKRYFTKHNEEYQVCTELRKMITFAPQNLIQDAPFTRISLVTCRNMLIYFNVSTQNQVLATLHFSMTVGGYLFLGSSETLGRISSEFDVIDDHWRIYRKKREIRLMTGQKMPMLTPTISSRGNSVRSIPASLTPDIRLLRAYDELLKEFLPAGFLLNENRELVHVFGEAGKFIRPGQGRMTLDLLEMLDTDLKVAIGAAIQKCIKELDTVSYKRVRVKNADGENQWFTVRVKPLRGKENDLPYVLVMLEEDVLEHAPPQPMGNSEVFHANVLSEEKIRSLETELQYTKENLQATIEEMETSNEELNATNEELIASNEELQSTNEELHSVNEELHTVNAEYQQKIEELTRLTDDMNNLLSSTEIGTIFLARDMTIRKFTPSAANYFRFRNGDIGRPLSEIVTVIQYDKLIEDCFDVMAIRLGIEKEVQSDNNEWIFLRIMPYKTSDANVDGIVITILNITTLKKTQELMIKQKNQTQMILDTMPARVWFKDTHNNIQRVNKCVSDELGLPISQIEGRRFADLYPTDESRQSYTFDKKVVDTRMPVLGIIHAVQGKDKSQNIKWMRTDRMPIFDADNEVEGVLVVSTDVTELQVAKNQLEETTRKFESFMEHTPIIQWALDDQNRFIFVNPAFSQFMGVTEEQCIGHKPAELLNLTADNNTFIQAESDNQKLLKNSAPIKQEVNLTINGKQFCLLVTKFAFDMMNDHKAIGGSAVDITELKHTQEQLVQITQRFELAVNGTNVGLWDWDTHEVCWYSDMYKQLLGYSETDTFPQTIAMSNELIHPDDVERVKSEINAHLNNDVQYDIEYRIMCKSGEYRWFRSKAICTRDENGIPTRMSGSIQDVDELVLAKQRLGAINKELEQRVRERTAELAKARDDLELRVHERTAELAHTNRSLSATNDELDQFAHVAAHDLRSPLRTIAGFSEFLKDRLIENSGDDEQAHDFINRIISAANRMDTLIESLLTFSSIGREKLKPRPTDLNKIVRSVIDDLQQDIHEYQAQIEFEKLPLISCDPTMVQQLFQNLIANAIKYSKDDVNPVVQIRTREVAPDFVFEVFDNGIGFKESDIDLMFQPFQRLGGNTRKKPAGHGVGLSICRRVVERHGGKIWASSVPGEGSTFTFTLPMTDDV
jgi:two-component system CheB/CheR fusion protein